MGRTDGEVAHGTGYEVAIGWRKECEQLQGRVAQLENQLSSARQECQRLRGEISQVTHTEDELIAHLKGENESLTRELQRIVVVNGRLMDERNKQDNCIEDENVALRLIIKHLVGLL